MAVMSNDESSFGVSSPHQAGEIDGLPSAEQRYDANVHIYPHRRPQLSPLEIFPSDNDHTSTLRPARINGNQQFAPNGVAVPHGQGGYSDDLSNLQHTAPAAMDGHTPPHINDGGAATPSPDTGEFPKGVAPMVPNMIPHYGRQVHAPSPTPLGQIFAHPMTPHQQFDMPDQMQYMYPASGGTTIGVQNLVGKAHGRAMGAPLASSSTSVPRPGSDRIAMNHPLYRPVPSGDKPDINVVYTGGHDHGIAGSFPLASGASDLPGQSNLAGFSQLAEQHQQPATVIEASQQPQDSIDTLRSPDPQQQTSLAQTEPSSAGNLSPLECTPSHSSSTSSRSVAKKSSKPPKSGNNGAGMQPPVKLGFGSGPTVHPPQHNLDSSTGILDLSGNEQELKEDVPPKVPKRAAEQAINDADDAVEDDGVRKNAKQVLQNSDTEAESELDARPKKGSRKGRSTQLAEYAKMTLPDYNTVLKFADRDAAIGSLQDRLNTIKDVFIAPGQDNTIPQNDQEIEGAVKSLLGAMKDLTNAQDMDSRGVKSRWLQGAKHPYSDEVMETTCWSIVDLCIRLHREGPSALSIGDPHYLPQIKKSAHLTFAERIKTIAILIRDWKARNDGLIKGDTLQTVVAAPLEALLSASNNSGANKARAKLLQIGKENSSSRKRKATVEVAEGTPKTATRKRKQSKKKVAVFNNSEAAAEEDAADGDVEPALDVVATSGDTNMPDIDAHSDVARSLTSSAASGQLSRSFASSA